MPLMNFSKWASIRKSF